MYLHGDRRLRLLLVVAGVVALVLLVRWIIASVSSPDRELISLLGLLVRVQITSTLVANALVFAAVVFAAAIIPFTVVRALQRSESEKPPRDRAHTTALPPPAAQAALDGKPGARPADAECKASKQHSDRTGDQQTR